MRFLALFGVLIGEGAMVIYSAQPIKMGRARTGHENATQPVEEARAWNQRRPFARAYAASRRPARKLSTLLNSAAVC
jgi:hypothetical protein